MKRSDGLWRFACVNVLVFFAVLWDWCWKGSRAMSDCKQMGAMSVIGWQMGERVKGVVAVSTCLFTTLQCIGETMFTIQVSEGWIKRVRQPAVFQRWRKWTITHPSEQSSALRHQPTHPCARLQFVFIRFYHFTSELSEKTNIVQRKKISKYICVSVGRVCDSVCLSNILKTCPEFNAFILRFSKIECHGIKKNGPGKRKKLSEIRWWQNDHWRVWHLGTQSNQRCSVYNKWLLAFEKKARRFIFMEKFTLWNAHKYIIFDMA